MAVSQSPTPSISVSNTSTPTPSISVSSSASSSDTPVLTAYGPTDMGCYFDESATFNCNYFCSCTAGGTVTYDGGSNIKSYGVIWDIIPYPTINGIYAMRGVCGYDYINGEPDGLFTFNVGLSPVELYPNTKYYIRAFAINNDNKIGYSPQMTYATGSYPPSNACFPQIIDSGIYTANTASSNTIFENEGFTAGDFIIGMFAAYNCGEITLGAETTDNFKFPIIEGKIAISQAPNDSFVRATWFTAFLNGGNDDTLIVNVAHATGHLHVIYYVIRYVDPEDSIEFSGLSTPSAEEGWYLPYVPSFDDYDRQNYLWLGFIAHDGVLSSLFFDEDICYEKVFYKNDNIISPSTATWNFLWHGSQMPQIFINKTPTDMPFNAVRYCFRIRPDDNCIPPSPSVTPSTTRSISVSSTVTPSISVSSSISMSVTPSISLTPTPSLPSLLYIFCTSTTYGSASQACLAAPTPDVNLYTTHYNDPPQVGYVFYTESACITPFVGNGNYYFARRGSSYYAITLNSNGVIGDVLNCDLTPPTPSISTTPSMSISRTPSMSVTSSITRTPTRT